jgi:hypothetical protein
MTLLIVVSKDSAWSIALPLENMYGILLHVLVSRLNYLPHVGDSIFLIIFPMT